MTYSSSLALSRQRLASRSQRSSSTFGSRSWGKNQNTTTFRDQEQRLGPVSNTIMLIILACLFGLLYLTQVTKTNAYSYEINELQTRAETLKNEHAELEVASARLQALERAKNSEANKSLVTVAPTATLQD
jgi:hypothetical protein